MTILRPPPAGLPWLPTFARDIVALFRQKLSAPLWLWGAATADLPTTPELGANEGALAYDDTTNRPTFYDGSNWSSLSTTLGTVTSVSVVTANGVSGSVATATTTPAITLTLGAITPTTVTASSTIAGTNITSGGDTIGNSASSSITTRWATARTVGITGDATWSSGSLDGTANVTAALTLATVNANVGSFGSATQVGTFTVNAKGLTTAAANVTITPAASSITGGAALTKADDTNVTLTLGGTPTAALLAAASITVGWSGTVAVARGGTAAANASDARTNLGLIIGTDVQAFDADLSTIAGLTATTDNFIVSVSSAWASRTPAQVRTTLGLVIGTNVQAWDADLDAIAALTGTSTIYYRSAANTWSAVTVSANVGFSGGTLGSATGDMATKTAANYALLAGATFTGDLINTNGFYSRERSRFVGWQSDPQADKDGPGLEVGATGGRALIFGYNRTGGAYYPVDIEGLTLAFGISGTPTFTLDSTFGNFANDAAAAIGGVPVKGLYRNGSVMMIRVA